MPKFVQYLLVIKSQIFVTKIRTIVAANELLITEHVDEKGSLVYKQFGPFQFRNDTLDHITIPNGRLAFDSKHSTFYEQYALTDHLGNVVVTFSDKNGDKELLEELSDFTENNEVFQRMVYYPFGMDIAHPALQDTIIPDQRRRYNGKESQKKFKIPYLNYHARMYDATIGRFTGVDPLAHQFGAWNPYHYVLNNPLRYVDPDGRAPQDKIIETSKGNFKYVKDQHGTNLISTHYLNGDVVYIRKGHPTVKIESGHAERKISEYRAGVAKRRRVIGAIGKAMENTGDIVATAGYIATPFTEGASLAVSAVGEGISVLGKAVTNSVKIEEKGFTKENIIDASADILFEVLPAPAEAAIKASNADNVTKKVLKAELQTLNKATEYGVDKTIEKSREQ